MRSRTLDHFIWSYYSIDEVIIVLDQDTILPQDGSANLTS